MLFEDESMIRDYQAIMKTWFPVGKQRTIPTCGKHEGVKLVGFLDYETLITLVDATELNTMVIDVKNDDGEITWKMDTGSVAEMEMVSRISGTSVR